MERMPTRSENLLAMHYDEQERILTITFRGGAVYQYSEVPARVYRSLLNAESKGSYFSQHIRDFYACEQVR